MSPAAQSADPFDNIDKVDPTGRTGIYVLPGHYKVQINSWKRGVTRKKRDFLVADLKVLESDNLARPVGSTMSWMVMLDSDAAPANVKNFIMAAMDCEGSEVTKEAVHASYAPNQPLSSTEVRLEAHDKPTKAGGQFTVCVFSAIQAAA